MSVDRIIARRLVADARIADESENDAYAAAERSIAERIRFRVEKPQTLEPARPAIEDHPAAVAVYEFGTLRRDGGDADDSVGQLVPVQQTPDFRFAARVEAVFQAICREETGQTETPDQTEKRLKKEAKLRRQGAAVCEGLEKAGIAGYRSDGFRIWTVDVHEGETDEQPRFRRVCVNPWIAYRLRLPVLNWLEYFLQGNAYARFWTLTSGQRCRSSELESRIERLHRRISQLNATAFMRDASAEIVFRSTELGSVEKTHRKAAKQTVEEMAGEVQTDEKGHWYHPHAHCIVILKHGPLPPTLWSHFLRKVHRFWKHGWDEGKRIRDVRECVKYVVKPGDMVRLAKTDPLELGRLHEILFRKKLVQPMGELKKLIKAAKAADLIPVRRFVNDVRKWVLIRDPNKAYVRDGQDSSPWKNAAGERASNSAVRKFMRLNSEGPRDPSGVEPDVCTVVARCAPAFNSRGVKSPRVVVMGTRLDLHKVLAHPLVRRLRSATRADYETGLRHAAAERGGLAALGLGMGPDRFCPGVGISVHTGTPTVSQPPAPGWFDAWDLAEAPPGDLIHAEN